MLKGKTPLLIAVSLALVGFGISYSAVQKERADARKGWNPMPVVVAAVDIAEGTVLTMDLVQQRSVPDQFITASVVKPDSASYVIGQKVLVPLQAGDPLLWSQFETTRTNERLSTKVQKQMRAFTIEAKAVTAVGGWVRPNDHVDILGTFKNPGDNETVAMTLLQNVVVLATGKMTGTTNVNLVPENERTYGHVSLLVVPEEAEILLLASELGSLSMSLRNEEDLSTTANRLPTRIQTLFDGEKIAKHQVERSRIIDIIRGNVRKESAP